ncbi:phosphoribosyltransferase family protein [Gryllotalpicola daejeonensis]|uniref:Phosphoribosyltransferase family protein n=1 Tax=Gryllotalpicola daejeonensis TaxID=993087 RepID=A0ABP7ZEB8_9MICO
MLFRDRDEAGRMLADLLLNLRAARPVVLGIPAGGVLVAQVVARELGAPLGAVASGCLTETDLEDRTVLVVDEGVNTGATMRAALETVAAAHPRQVFAAAPVAPRRLSLGRLAADLYAIARPEPLSSVRRWYAELPEVSEDEVRAALGGQDWAYAGATSL